MSSSLIENHFRLTMQRNYVWSRPYFVIQHYRSTVLTYDVWPESTPLDMVSSIRCEVSLAILAASCSSSLVSGMGTI